MPQTLRCASCQTTFHIREEDADQEVRCPKCAAPVSIASVLPVESAVQEGEPAAPALTSTQTKRCPRCGERISIRAQKCRYCKAWLDEDEEELPGQRADEYQPCPRCKARGATRVTFTFWGSFYGPYLLSHVRCRKCGYAYNGKTGRSNLLAAIFFVTVPLVLILAIIGGLGFLIWRLRFP